MEATPLLSSGGPRSQRGVHRVVAIALMALAVVAVVIAVVSDSSMDNVDMRIEARCPPGAHREWCMVVPAVGGDHTQALYWGTPYRVKRKAWSPPYFTQSAADKRNQANTAAASQFATGSRVHGFVKAWQTYTKSKASGSPPTFARRQNDGPTQKQALFTFNQAGIAQKQYADKQRTQAANDAADERIGAFAQAWQNYQKSSGSGSPPTFDARKGAADHQTKAEVRAEVQGFLSQLVNGQTKE